MLLNGAPPIPIRQSVIESERAKWLTVEEAADVLGTSKPTIMRAIHDGHLKLFASGNVWRIHVDSLKECQKIIDEWKD